ncbi:MAG: ImmA/IrrE family metallo-endopeptidase [Syntrophomonas sp.]
MSKSDEGSFTAFKLRQDLGITPNECIDLDQVAEKLSIRVKRKDLGVGIEGACKSVGAKRLIVLNPNPFSSQKERFTFAHEIGHLLIHHGSYICPKDSFYLYKTQNDKEKEANDFAVELLLPRRAILDIFIQKDLTFTLIEQVAEKYKTSLSVAAIRLIQIFNDSAAIIWHNGQHVVWKVKSDHCLLKLSDVISPMALVYKTDESKTDIKGNVDIVCWIDNEVDNLICEEETHYFTKLKMYFTILKFYEED